MTSAGSEQNKEVYEDLPYTGTAYRLTHPDCIAPIAAVFGLTPAHPGRCRVLELGCAGGLNLVPMAFALPDSAFVGIDTGASHIAAAEKFRAALGLNNIRFEERNILDVDPAFGKFDYIICHGIFSWVPRNVQDKILEICRINLTEDGLAYISYNTLPGWRVRGIIRDTMLRAAGTEGNINVRLEKAIRGVQELGALIEGATDFYSQLLQREVGRVLQHPRWYLAHDYLSEVNDAFYFTEFAERIAKFGLQHVSDADISRMTSSGIPKNARQRLGAIARDAVHYGQLLDMVRHTMFRRSILCRRDKEVKRQIDPELTRSLRASSRMQLQPEGTDLAATFLDPRGLRLELAHPLAIKILTAVSARWPECIPVAELLDLFSPAEQSAALGSLVEGYFSEMLDLRFVAPRCAGPGRPFSAVSPIAAYLAASSMPMINLRHDPVQLEPQELDAFTRLMSAQAVADAAVQQLAKKALLMA